MPIYEYICQDCGSKFDSLRSIKEANDPITCIKCNGNSTKRLISAFFTQSDRKMVTSNSCSSCSGGNCSSCGH